MYFVDMKIIACAVQLQRLESNSMIYFTFSSAFSHFSEFQRAKNQIKWCKPWSVNIVFFFFFSYSPIENLGLDWLFHGHFIISEYNGICYVKDIDILFCQNTCFNILFCQNTHIDILLSQNTWKFYYPKLSIQRN